MPRHREIVRPSRDGREVEASSVASEALLVSAELEPLIIQMLQSTHDYRALGFP